MLNNSYKKIVVDANGNKYESYKTVRYVHESPTSENSSNLQINTNKSIMTINSLELTGGETATTDDIIVTLHGKNLFDWSAVKSTQIVIEENGRKIIMPIRTESNSNGYTGTGSTFRQLFPRLKAGDTATLSFNSNAEIKKIYISTVVVMWASGQTMTVTEDMLDCAVAFYGNYYAHGQTEQVIISDFQMELGTTATAYEPYFNKTVQIPNTYPLSSTDKLIITKNSVKYNDTDITSEVTGLDEFFIKTGTNTAIIDTNYTMGSISADVKKLFVSYKKSIYQADE